MTLSESTYLKKCRMLIEQKLGWGGSDQWAHKHFKQLSTQVFDATGTLLNHNTLKRFWGKVSYTGNQSTTTKNALSQFAGYADWHDFLLKEFNVHLEKDDLCLPANTQQKLKKRKRISMVFLIALCILSLPVFLLILSQRKKTYDTSQIQFYCNNPCDYPPHYFTIHYNLSTLNAENISIRPDYLQPSTITSDSGSINYLYLLPGHGKVHLMIGKQMIQSIPIHTITDGWMATHYTNMEDVIYFRPDSTQDRLTVSPQRLVQLGVDTSRTFYLNYYNMQEYGISGDNFEAEAKVRNQWTHKLFSTGTVHFGIWGEDGTFGIHVAEKGQPYIIKQTISEQTITAHDFNMQPFSLEMSQWQTLNIKVKNHTAVISINGTPVLTKPYSRPIGLIKGVWFRTKELGEIDYIHIRNDSISYDWDHF